MSQITQLLSKRIRNLRNQKDFSQEYLSTKIGISQQAYQKIESGVTKIGITQLMKIADVLEVELVELIQSKDENKPIKTSKEEIEDTLRLIQHLTTEVAYLREQNNKLLSLLESRN